MRSADVSPRLEARPILDPYRSVQATRFTGGPDCCCESYAGPYSGAKAVFESAAARYAVKKTEKYRGYVALGKTDRL